MNKIIKPGRTLSGVAPLAVMMKPFACPGECVYCPLEAGMPKSYLSDEPAAQRAKRLNFDPVNQVEMRLAQLMANGHPTDKLEIIIIGGTFSAYPRSYKVRFVKGIYDAANGEESASVDEAMKKNETAKRRIVALSVETRPDWVTSEEVRLIRRLGVTKVQLGVQAVDEEVLTKSKRGHGVMAIAEATRLLRNAGMKICYHMMPNLPGSSPEKDIEMSKLIYSDPRFKPDYVKIYPCMVIEKTELAKMYARGEHRTYSDGELKYVLKEISKMTPPWVRIDRLVRDISRKWVAVGTTKTNLRQEVERELINEGRLCQCIRCREVKGDRDTSEPELLIEEIETLGGQEIFVSFEKAGKLYALLRLRLPNSDEEMLFPELEKAAIVREVHTYGKVVPIGKRGQEKQHRGLGKKLMEAAERIAKERGYKKLAVISAVGTREYYRKLGYKLAGEYMVKRLT